MTKTQLSVRLVGIIIALGTGCGSDSAQTPGAQAGYPIAGATGLAGVAGVPSAAGSGVNIPPPAVVAGSGAAGKAGVSGAVAGAAVGGAGSSAVAGAVASAGAGAGTGAGAGGAIAGVPIGQPLPPVPGQAGSCPTGETCQLALGSFRFCGQGMQAIPPACTMANMACGTDKKGMCVDASSVLPGSLFCLYLGCMP
ncbi:MAG: hypothetical protein RL701_7656 [Pseudomonadota bacterium]|jgi:hypothetical protein